MRNNRYSFKKRRSSSLKKIIICLGFLLIVAVALYLSCRVETVIVEGATRYTEEEMIDEVIKTPLDKNSLYLYFKYKYFEQEQIPFIQDIDIKLLDKSTVKLMVYEKVVTGCVEFMGEFLYFDKDGIIVESSKKKETDVPQIIGLSYQRIMLHEQLVVQKEELFDTILNLTQLIKKYKIPVDKITFSKDYEVTLTCNKVKVLLGRKEYYDEPMAELGNMLPKVKEMDITINMKNFKPGDDSIAYYND